MTNNQSLLEDFHFKISKTSILSPNDVSYFNQENKMVPNTFRVIYADVKNHPLGYRDFDISDSKITDVAVNETILKDALGNGSAALFLAVTRTLNKAEYQALEQLEHVSEVVGFQMLDMIGSDGKGYRFLSRKENVMSFEEQMIDYLPRKTRSEISSTYQEKEQLNLEKYLKEHANEQTPSEFYQDVIWTQLKEAYPFLTKTHSKKLINYISKLSESNREELGVVILKKGKVEHVESLFKGGRSKAIVDPKVLMNKIVQEKSDGVFILHNHPSTRTDHSMQDRQLTQRIKEASDYVGVKYIDHFVVAKGKIEPDVAGLQQVKEYQQLIKPKRIIRKPAEKNKER